MPRKSTAKTRAVAAASPLVAEAVKTAVDAAAAQAVAEAAPTAEYTTLRNVLHDGVLYRRGVTIELCDDEAAPLLLGGHISLIPVEPDAESGEAK